MIIEFVERFSSITRNPQVGKETFYPRRNKKENELDVNKTITEQFNLLRVVDNERYPAYFYKYGKKYILKIYKDND